jgi:CRISPR-associated exonuclease Cas4
VEYKSGRAREDGHAAVQLCAQALCLEEMFAVDVPEGALFFAASQRRETVAIDDGLRARTLDTIEAVREMLAGDRLPPANYDRRCRQCSLLDACLPQTLVRARTASGVYRPISERELP